MGLPQRSALISCPVGPSHPDWTGGCPPAPSSRPVRHNQRAVSFSPLPAHQPPMMRAAAAATLLSCKAQEGCGRAHNQIPAAPSGAPSLGYADRLPVYLAAPPRRTAPMRAMARQQQAGPCPNQQAALPSPRPLSTACMTEGPQREQGSLWQDPSPTGSPAMIMTTPTAVGRLRLPP